MSGDPHNPFRALEPDPTNPYAAYRGPIIQPMVWNGEPPKVKFWAKVYDIVMILLYLLVVIVGAFILISADEIAKNDPQGGSVAVRVVGGVYLVLGVVLTALFVVPFFWTKGTGAWVYQLVLIVLGLTSCITWPLTIPLMIYWIKDREGIIQT